MVRHEPIEALFDLGEVLIGCASGADLQPVNTAGAKLGDLVTDAHIPQVPQAVGRISGDDEDSRTRVGPGERDGRGEGSLRAPTFSSHEEQSVRSGAV